MNLTQIQAFLGWSLLIHVALLTFVFLLFVIAKRPISRLHQRFFPLSNDQLLRSYFNFLATYKILIVVFFAVPYVVIRFLL